LKTDFSKALQIYTFFSFLQIVIRKKHKTNFSATINIHQASTVSGIPIAKNYYLCTKLIFIYE